MSEATMITVAKQTRQKLREIRITKRESYDEIINRLITEAGKHG